MKVRLFKRFDRGELPDENKTSVFGQVVTEVTDEVGKAAIATGRFVEVIPGAVRKPNVPPVATGKVEGKNEPEASVKSKKDALKASLTGKKE